MVRLATTRRTQRNVAAAFDFSKGLRFNQTGMLVDKSASDVKNIDWSSDGGWCARRVVAPAHLDNLVTPPCWVGSYENETGQTWIVMSFNDGSIRALTGPTVGGITQLLKGPGGGCWRGQETNFKLYLQDGVSQPLVWNGTALTAVPTGTYNVPPAGAVYNPTGVGMPIGKYQVVWSGHHWIMNTLEAGVRHCNRIRSSYPLFNLKGEVDYTQEEYLDLDIGADGECITGTVECGGQLYIFKDHSTYQVGGSNWSNDLFSFSKMGSIGASNPDAIACCGGEVYFYDSVQGFARIIDVPNTGGRFQYIDARGAGNWFGEPVTAVMDGMYIPNERAAEVTVTCCDGKVLYSVPWKDGGRRTFAFDSALNTWTCYDLELGPSTSFTPKNGKAYCVAVNRSPDCAPRLIVLGQMGNVDDFGSCKRAVESWVCTFWISGDNPSQTKVFRCVTLLVEGASALTTEVRADFNATSRLTTATKTLSQGETRLGRTLPQERITPGGPLTDVPCCDDKELVTGVDGLSCLQVLCAEPDPKGCIRIPVPKRETKAISLRISSSSTDYCVRGIMAEFTIGVKQ